MIRIGITYIISHILKFAKYILHKRRDIEFVNCDLYEVNEMLDKQYPVENPLCGNTTFSNQRSYNKRFLFKKSKTSNLQDSKSCWNIFLDSSIIPTGYKHAGLSMGGFIWEYQEWCLPSWIWTNAAKVRYYCSVKNLTKAKETSDILIKYQNKCGGWIVRNDYTNGSVIPQLAPNDSAYIANNALLCTYELSGEEKYLLAAIKCADWIIQTARPDGFVYLGCNYDTQEWNTDRNIVDTGFTAGLFARLYMLTMDEKYKSFLKHFVAKYVELFYNKERKRFWTALHNDKPLGGSFTRGQAWALEGIIPAYQVLQEQYLFDIINNTISTLISEQHKDGSWAHNLNRPYRGNDCKGIPVVALSLYKWYKISKRGDLLPPIYKALNWCVNHTVTNGRGKGGIYDFSLEGAIVHHSCTSTAFVYSSAYALELCHLIETDNI